MRCLREHGAPTLRRVTASQQTILEQTIIEKLFDDPKFAETPAGTNEICVHATHRLTEFTNNVIPWLQSCLNLGSASVLEIGAGTGASVAALAETGASDLGIDILGKHLEVARTRLELHGIQNATVFGMNATEIADIDRKFDLILYSATLEHMTLEERKVSLQAAWS